MDARNYQIYNAELNLNGTLGQLIDWSYRYTDDFSDEALKEISKLASRYGLEKRDIEIPLLVLAERERERKDPDLKTMPYERMKIDHYVLGNVSYSESRDGMEIEIREEDDKVLIAAYGVDPEYGSYTAAGAYSVDEFMAGEGNFLEVALGMVLAHNCVYDEEPEM